MTIPQRLNFKQPSEPIEVYLTDKSIPFAARARLHNAYIRSFFPNEPAKNNIQYEPKKTKARKKYTAKPYSRNSSANNWVRGIGQKVVAYFTSGGKGRPSRKLKVVFKTTKSIRRKTDAAVL